MMMRLIKHEWRREIERGRSGQGGKKKNKKKKKLPKVQIEAEFWMKYHVYGTWRKKQKQNSRKKNIIITLIYLV